MIPSGLLLYSPGRGSVMRTHVSGVRAWLDWMASLIPCIFACISPEQVRILPVWAHATSWWWPWLMLWCLLAYHPYWSLPTIGWLDISNICSMLQLSLAIPNPSVPWKSFSISTGSVCKARVRVQAPNSFFFTFVIVGWNCSVQCTGDYH